MADTYMAYNGAAPGAAAAVPVTTGAVVKTLLQLATPATKTIKIHAWSLSFDGFVAAAPIRCELLQTSGAATVTAYVAGDIYKLNNKGAPASQLTLGVTASGYTASSEGTPGTVQLLDMPQLITPTAGQTYFFPLGEYPELAISSFLRIRVTAPAGVNAYAAAIWEE